MKNEKAYKRLPPYGQILSKQLESGFKPSNDIFLFVGKLSWEKTKCFCNTQVVLMLPMNTHPDDFRWPVNNHSVLCVDTGGVHYQIIRKLAHSLLTYEATIVRVVLSSHKLVVFRKKEKLC